MPYGKGLHKDTVIAAICGFDKPGSLHFIIKCRPKKYVGIYQMLEHVLFLGSVKRCRIKYADYLAANGNAWCVDILGNEVKIDV